MDFITPHNSPYQATSLYPVKGTQVQDMDNIRLPDLGQAKASRLGNEFKPMFDTIKAHFGADYVASLAMGNMAQDYGYMPLSKAVDELLPQAKKDILMGAFKKDSNLAMQTYGHLFNDKDDKPTPKRKQDRKMGLD